MCSKCIKLFSDFCIHLFSYLAAEKPKRGFFLHFWDEENAVMMPPKCFRTIHKNRGYIYVYLCMYLHHSGLKLQKKCREIGILALLLIFSLSKIFSIYRIKFLTTQGPHTMLPFDH